MKRLFMCGILLLSATAIYPADLKDFSIYGSVRMGTWLDRSEKFLSDTIFGKSWDTVHKIGADPHPDYHFNIVPYGNLGLKYKGDRIGATFELKVQTALNNAYVSGVTGLTVYRVEKYYAMLYRFFAELYINDYFTFLIGQDYTPIDFLNDKLLCSNQMFYDNNSFGNTGSLYEGRKPMLEMIYHTQRESSMAGIEAKLAVIKVDTCSVRYYGQQYPLTNTKFPKVEASCEGRLTGNSVKANIKAVGGFQQYELVQKIDDITSGSYDSIKHLPVNCYAAGVHGDITVSSISLIGDFATGQNWGPYGIYIGNPFMFRGYQNSYLVNVFYPSFTPDTTPGGLIKNNNLTTEADVILKITASPSVSFETGFGWVHASNTDSTTSANWHDNVAFYLQSEITVMETVTFTPEIGMYYYGPKNGYGRMLYAGFGTRFDF